MVEELPEARESPLQLHVGHEARDEHEVKGPIADDLVGNVDISTEGVTRSGPTTTLSPACEHNAGLGNFQAAQCSLRAPSDSGDTKRFTTGFIDLTRGYGPSTDRTRTSGRTPDEIVIAHRSARLAGIG